MKTNGSSSFRLLNHWIHWVQIPIWGGPHGCEDSLYVLASIFSRTCCGGALKPLWAIDKSREHMWSAYSPQLKAVLSVWWLRRLQEKGGGKLVWDGPDGPAGALGFQFKRIAHSRNVTLYIRQPMALNSRINTVAYVSTAM